MDKGMEKGKTVLGLGLGEKRMEKGIEKGRSFEFDLRALYDDDDDFQI